MDHWYDSGRGVLVIRKGKGKKDRVVPIGERAVAYLNEARPALVAEPDDGVVFLTSTGRPFHPNHCSRLIRAYVAAAGVQKRGACHLLRHTMATGILKHGADVRVIQEILGHARLTTTQLYTRVSIRLLKAVHTATHPAATLGRPPRPASPSDADPLPLAASEAAKEAQGLIPAPEEPPAPSGPGGFPRRRPGPSAYHRGRDRDGSTHVLAAVAGPQRLQECV